MNLIVQGIVPPTKLASMQASPEAAKLPSEVDVSFGQTGHPTAGVATMFTITGGTLEQQEQVRDWWKATVTKAGFRTGLV